MGSTYPVVVESWPPGRPVWIASDDGKRHYVPALGGVVGVCCRPLPTPPVMAFPDLDETCCPACLRLVMADILPTLARMP